MSLYRIIWYVSLALGIPGNILSAIVWLRRHVISKNSSVVYLAALAIDDLAFQFFWLIVYDFHCLHGWFCNVMFVLHSSAAALEPLLVLGFSVERLIAIIRPLQVCRIRFTFYKPHLIISALDNHHHRRRRRRHHHHLMIQQ